MCVWRPCGLLCMHAMNVFRSRPTLTHVTSQAQHTKCKHADSSLNKSLSSDLYSWGLLGAPCQGPPHFDLYISRSSLTCLHPRPDRSPPSMSAVPPPASPTLKPLASPIRLPVLLPAARSHRLPDGVQDRRRFHKRCLLNMQLMLNSLPD